jgi:hypothetical protein
MPPPDVLRAEVSMKYVVSPECVACDVEDGVAILDLRSNTYFSLDPVGADVWQELAKPSTVDDLAQAIAAEYAVSQDACRGDIARLLDEMSRHGLIQAA